MQLWRVLAFALLALLSVDTGAGSRMTVKGGRVVGGYNLANEIATIRASSDYGTAFTNTSAHPLEPAGLALPTAPSGMSPVSCTTLSCVRTASNSNGQEITLTGGPFTESAGTVALALGGTSGCQNIRLILTGVTVNPGSTNDSLVTIDPRCRYVEVIGGTLNGGGTINGRDIKFYNVTAVGPGTGVSGGVAGNYWQWYGHRIAIEKSSFTDFQGGVFFTGAAKDAIINGTISGTTLTVNSTTSGAIAVGQRLIQVFGVSIPIGGLSVIADLGGGQWQIEAGGSGTGGIWAETASSNLIFANSEAHTPGTGSNHESASRFNGCQLCVILDSRLYTETKASLRSHADYSIMAPSGPVLWKRNQVEQGTGVQAQEPGDSGIFPATTAIYMDGNNFYNSATVVGLGIPYRSQISGCFTGNGTTATIETQACGAYVRHGLDATEVVDITGVSPSGFNGTSITLTRTGSATATYPNTTTCSSPPCNLGSINRSKVINTVFWMKNNLAYGNGAPNNVGWLPGGLGSPSGTWSTIPDTATSASNGNFTRTYVSTPAWSRQN